MIEFRTFQPAGSSSCSPITPMEKDVVGCLHLKAGLQTFEAELNVGLISSLSLLRGMANCRAII